MDLVRVKICGLRTLSDVAAVAAAGAAYCGFMFFPPSPRHLTIDQATRLPWPPLRVWQKWRSS